MAKNDPDMERGLYGKYLVDRLNDEEGKHDDCFFFVLDPEHDRHALVALIAYIESCKLDYPLLAKDLKGKLMDIPLR